MQPKSYGKFGSTETFWFQCRQNERSNMEAKEAEQEDLCHCKHKEIWERFRCQSEQVAQHELSSYCATRTNRVFACVKIGEKSHLDFRLTLNYFDYFWCHHYFKECLKKEECKREPIKVCENWRQPLVVTLKRIQPLYDEMRL